MSNCKKNCPPFFCTCTPSSPPCIFLSDNQLSQLSSIFQSLAQTTLPALLLSPTPQNKAAVQVQLNQLLAIVQSGFLNPADAAPLTAILNNTIFILNYPIFSPIIFIIELQKLVNQFGTLVNQLCAPVSVRQHLLELLKGILAVLIQFEPKGPTGPTGSTG
ncbi:TPA: collagen-like repeat preface domain-containing protein, partial [Bacillus wiedmannii]|nr:collagen-like repeat preface domain-containing protein [Bacillus wiedmannii]